MTNVKSIVPSGSHTLFLKRDGTLMGVGLNQNYQLGDGTTTTRSAAVQIATSVINAAAEGGLSVFVKSDRTAWGCGNVTSLGISGVSGARPARIMAEVESVFAKGTTTSFKKTDGTLWSTGRNDLGQLGVGHNYPCPTPVFIGANIVSMQHNLYLTEDGSILTSVADSIGYSGGGLAYVTKPVPILSEVKKVCTTSESTFILDNYGDVYATGANTYGNFGIGRIGDFFLLREKIQSNVRDIAVTQTSALFLMNDGRLLGAGKGVGFDILGASFLFPVEISKSVVAISACGHKAAILKSDGTAWTSFAGSPWSFVMPSVKSIYTSESNWYFVDIVGALWAMGSAPVGDGSELERTSPVKIMDNVRSVASRGNYSTMIVKEDSTLWAYGNNYSGSLGTGDTVPRLSPIQVASGVLDVAAGTEHNLILLESGEVLAVGSNKMGQFGDASFTSSTVPIQSMSRALRIFAGPYASFFVNTEGKLLACGYLPPGSGTDQFAGNLRKTINLNHLLITEHPTSTNAYNSQSLKLRVATNFEGMKFQWYKNGSPIPGAQSDFLDFSPIAYSDAGSYACLVRSENYSEMSNAAQVEVRQPELYILSTTGGGIIAPGDHTDLAVSIVSSLPASFQWSKDGEEIPGATQAAYSIAEADFMDEGSYTCLVSSNSLSATTPPILVNVQPSSVFADLDSDGVDDSVERLLAPLGFTPTQNSAQLRSQLRQVLTLVGDFYTLDQIRALHTGKTTIEASSGGDFIFRFRLEESSDLDVWQSTPVLLDQVDLLDSEIAIRLRSRASNTRFFRITAD